MDETETFWTCPNCNKQVEEHFAACWNCQHNRDGLMAQGLSTSEEASEEYRPETSVSTDEARRTDLPTPEWAREFFNQVKAIGLPD